MKNALTLLLLPLLPYITAPLYQNLAENGKSTP